MLFAVMWMDLENIMLTEINQTEKDKYRMIPLTCGIHLHVESRKYMWNPLTYGI